MLGLVGALTHVRRGHHDYLHIRPAQPLLPHAGPVGTVVMCADSQSALDELEHVAQSALRVFTDTVVHHKALLGGIEIT